MNVLLISDQPLTVLALRAVLRAVGPSVEAYDAAHLGEAMELLAGPRTFGLAVLDLDMQGTRRLAGAALLRQLWPKLPMAVIASARREEDVLRAEELDLVAHLFKTAETEELRGMFAHILAQLERQSAVLLAA